MPRKQKQKQKKRNLNVVQRAKRSERRKLNRLRRRENGVMFGEIADQRVLGSGIGTRNVEKAIKYGVLPRNLRLGSTQNGRHAAIKALHPACELGAAQWPDRNTADTVAMENLDVVDIPPPPAVEGAVMDKWNINFYLMPFPDCVCLIYRWWEGQPQPSINGGITSGNVKITGQADMWSTTYTMIYSPPWDVTGDYPGDYFQQIRLTARSATIELVASGLYDQGTVYAGQFGADITNVPLPASAIEKKVMVRLMAAFRLCRQNEDLDMDQALEMTEGLDMVDGPPVDETGFFTIYQQLPDSFTDLAQVDKKYYQNDARSGVYLPLKHSATDVLDLQPTSQQYHLCIAEPTESAYRWGHHVMFSDSWQVGTVMFRNLVKEASLNAKFISDVEGAPLSGSIMAKLAKPAPKLDQLAIDQTQEVMCRLPSAFPAEANTLGTILNHIGKWLANSGLPILSNIGSLTQSGLGQGVLGLLDNVI